MAGFHGKKVPTTRVSIVWPFMLISCQREEDPDDAVAPLVGRLDKWQPGSTEPHQHRRHQLISSFTGVLHLSTAVGQWVVPPARAVLIEAGTEHSLMVKRPAEVGVLYARADAYPMALESKVRVVGMSPLVRELFLACTRSAWDYQEGSNESRLAAVLMDQLELLDQAPSDLPLPSDKRALKVVKMLSDDPSNREPLDVLAQRAGSSKRTIERLFVTEANMTFGAWRQRQRLIMAVEALAYGESVKTVAMDVGYESASSFVAAFRAMFGVTPARYFRTS